MATTPKIVTRTRQDLINSTGYAFETPPSISANSNANLNTAHATNQDDDSLRHSASLSDFPAAPTVPPTHTNSNKTQRRRLNECCYSISNLLLIGASIAGLVVLVAFIQDDPLYEYGEHVLSLAFYRQLIFIIIILPLILLIPIANAVQSFLFTGHQDKTNDNHQHAGEAFETVLRLKLAYQLLVLILTFLALIFVAPYIRSGPLASSIELEIQKHMRFRYENNFSFQFLDAIQEQYQCCDQLWYRANMNDYLPTTCFVPGSGFSLTWDITCSWALAYLVSHRCAILAACLVLVLIALVCLMAIDLMELLVTSSSRPSTGRHNYKVSTSQLGASSLSSNGSFKRRYDDSGHAHDTPTPKAQLNGNSSNRLASSERQHDVPLLRAAGTSAATPTTSSFSGSRPEVNNITSRPEPEVGEPILLTRANYQLIERERSQSPVFKTRLDDGDDDRHFNHQDFYHQDQNQAFGQGFDDRDNEQDERPMSRSSNASTSSKPIKSALKKTSSSIDDFHDDQSDGSLSSLEDYAQKLRQSTSYLGTAATGSAVQPKRSPLQREQPTRRSLLSVRFAE